MENGIIKDNSSFLDKLTDYIAENHSEQLDRLCVVFPGRRAGLYLKKKLSAKLKKACWSPLVFSIEDFICELAGLKITDNIRLLTILYQCIKKSEKPEFKSFGDFLKWGPVLLNDFNDIDLYLVNAEEIFSYLSESKAISLWNIDGEPLTVYQMKYLKLFNSLSSYYRLFNKELNEKNQAYQGMVYRYIAENIDQYIHNKKWERILFAGFNAMTPSEEIIIQKLVQHRKAEVFWDADNYYMENDMHEAGKIIKKNFKALGIDKFNWLSDNFKNSNKEIQILGAVNNTGQVKIAGNILKANISELVENEQSLLNTAVVLVDENLLIPLLNSIPEEIPQLNITMGYPLINSLLFSLIDSLFILHEHTKNTSQELFTNTADFYFKDLIRVLTHPYLIRFIGVDESAIVDKITKSNKVFWNKEEVFKIIPLLNADNYSIIQSLFDDWNSEHFVIIEILCDFIISIQSKLLEENNDNNPTDNVFRKIEVEFVNEFSKIISNMKISFEEISEKLDLKTLHLLFRQVVKQTRLPFYGEPLKGLQIMGLLETRALDFEKLVVLSVNEGLLPSEKSNNSLIPYDIKRNFKMGTHKEQDAVYAYHFYRLLQRADKIYLLYNTEIDDFGKGEKSRFIKQLMYELPVYNKNIKITNEFVYAFPEKSEVNYSIYINKTETIQILLRKYAESGLSPSAINTYRNCKLKFYFNHILKLKENKEILESVDAVTLGNIIHGSLQEMYKNLEGNKLSQQHIDIFLKNSENILKKQFTEIMKNNEYQYGKNHLIFKVAYKLVNKFLNKEKDFIKELNDKHQELTIVSIENYQYKVVDIHVHDEIIRVKLKGKADRLDSFGNALRIIDYKTGMVEKKEITLKNIEDLVSKPEMNIAFQLLFYAYLIENKADKAVHSGMINFRSLSKGFQPLKYIDEIISESLLKEFDILLKKIVTELYDKQVPFDQTGDIEVCSYCSYKMICNRN